MKKLLLASNGKFLFDTGYGLLKIPAKETKILYVTTASKGVDSTKYLEAHKQAMKDKGYWFEEIDVEGKSEEDLRQAVSRNNVIHIEGGNTFYLLKAVKETGFDKILKEAIDSGVVYVGTSAGSYIACPTIETSTWGPVVKDRHGLEDLTALSFVPFIMRVHYTDDVKDLIAEKKKTASHPLRILRDGQAILVQDENYKFIGEGEEVIL